MSDDGNPRLVAALSACWLGLFGAGFMAFYGTGRTGDGFTRGMNRIELFLQWQSVALMVAIAGFVLARRLPRGSRARRLGQWPLMATGFVVLGLVAAVAVSFWLAA